MRGRALGAELAQTTPEPGFDPKRRARPVGLLLHPWLSIPASSTPARQPRELRWCSIEPSDTCPPPSIALGAPPRPHAAATPTHASSSLSHTCRARLTWEDPVRQIFRDELNLHLKNTSKSRLQLSPNQTPRPSRTSQWDNPIVLQPNIH
jgi:hypothetical protein